MPKKVVAVVLALVMCASLCTFACADGQSVKQYGKYVSLGDSISCGFTEEYIGHEELWFTASEQAYCWKVAKDVGASDTYVGGFSGARCEELLLALGGDIPLVIYNSIGGYFEGLYNRMMESSGVLQEKVAQSELITLCIGSNDICLYPIKAAGLTAGDFEQPDIDLAAKIAKVVEYIYKGYNNLMANYPKLLDRIYEMNEDAEVVVMGTYNPFQNAPLLDETVLPIGTAVSAVTDLVNLKLEKMAKEYGAKFVNIANVETWYNSLSGEPVAIISNADDFLLNIHPTKTGYDYIHRLIRNALTEEVKPVSTDITLDLNGLDPKGIYSVTVNGVPTKDYKVTDDYTVVIECSSKYAVTATVKSCSGGKVQMYTWQLIFCPEEGYSSYELAKTGDAKQHIVSVTTKVYNTATTVKGSLKKLFGR